MDKTDHCLTSVRHNNAVCMIRGINYVTVTPCCTFVYVVQYVRWWRHQMEIFSALLAICAGNSPVTGEFPAQRPVTRSFDVFFDPRQNKRLSKQWWGRWFETPSRPLLRHCYVHPYSVWLIHWNYCYHYHPQVWAHVHLSAGSLHNLTDFK